MKKKIFIVLACLCVAVLVFSACNKSFKQKAVTAVPADAVVTGNGGKSVKVGNYLYFVNGYVGDTDVDNTFGTPYKSAIFRVQLNEDGSIKAGTCERIAPKNVVDTSTKGGIYVYNGWIYYATPNTEKDKTGTVNTTYLDFFRTKLDASLTEKIWTIEGRNTDYAFYEGRLVYVLNNSLYSVDVETKKETVLIDGKLTTAKLIRGADGTFKDYIVYTRALPDELKNESYNQLCIIKADGSDNKVLIDGDTYDETKTDIKNIFTIGLLDIVVSNESLTLYYTKSYTTGGSSVSVGTYCYMLNGSKTFDKAQEKRISTSSLSGIVPIGYEQGVLVTENSMVNKYGYQQAEIEKLIERSVTVRFVEGDYVYYTETSSATALYRFPLNGDGVEEKVFSTTGISTTGNMFDVQDGYVYFIDTEYNYLYRYNFKGELGGKPELVGVMTEEDKKAYDEKHAED